MATQLSFSKSLPDLSQSKTASQKEATTSQNDSGLYSSSRSSLNDIADIPHDGLEHLAVDGEGYTPMTAATEDNTYDEPVFPLTAPEEPKIPFQGTTVEAVAVYTTGHTHRAMPELPPRFTTGEQMDTTKPGNIEIGETQKVYDKLPTEQKNSDEYDTVIGKSAKYRTSIPTILAAVSIVALILGTVALGISLYNCISTTGNAQPLTQDDWAKIRQIVTSEVKGEILAHYEEKIALLSERIELHENVTTNEIESLKSQQTELRTTNQEYRNKTNFTIVRLSEQANKSDKQITTAINDLVELREKAEILETDFSLKIIVLESLINSTEMELQNDLGHLNIEMHENLTTLERNFRIDLQELANATATDVAEFSLQLNLTQGQVDAIQNSTYQLEQQQNKTVAELEILINTDIVLDATITEINSNLTENQYLLQDELRLEIIALKTLINSTEMELQDDFRAFDTKVRENLTVLERNFESELHKIAITANDSFTATTNLIISVGNDSASSIQQVRIELDHEVNTTQATLESLRENTTTHFETLSTSLEGAKDNFMSQIRTSKELINVLAVEARSNHTVITRTVTTNNEMQATNLQTLQTKLDRDINQVGTDISRVRTTTTNNRQGIADLERKVVPIENRIKTLDSSQRSLFGDLQRVNNKVRGYHSNGATSLSNTTTVRCLSIIIACLLINWF